MSWAHRSGAPETGRPSTEFRNGHPLQHQVLEVEGSLITILSLPGSFASRAENWSGRFFTAPEHKRRNPSDSDSDDDDDRDDQMSSAKRGP
ncbi:hypothetical protein KQX54_018986 [Cotesia glomerata]|uniref:Uncharacterized protein n=1 Tax=Cotesia glomerata TaxID=32391 RepID=A0AAV7I9I0_COTGL|nr:hypothetical protein KQX54_018986 [Cotesia glomerata]